MRRFINLAIVSYFILLFSSCTNNDFRWTKYTAPDGSFSIRMPASAKVFDRQEQTPFGKQVVHYVSWKPSTFELNKFRLFQVSYTDCPARYTIDSSHTNVSLDSSINLRKRDFTESDINSEPIEINGYSGRAFIYDPASENVVTIVKECVANHRRYDITVIAKRNYPTNNEIGDYFNSFTVLR